jgi:hypothetical protein
VEGDLAAIAAPRDSDLASSSGAVYVYLRVAGLWGFEAKLYPDVALDLPEAARREPPGS